MKKALKIILPNLCIVIAVMLLVFVCIDYYNPAMQFIDNDITKVLIFVLALLSFIVSIVCLSYVLKDQK
ncbi:MAG: hypothetical protein IJO48_03215 [Clostridia bacterium]|nr:hypothetical protein [Clostridia bacterium]